MPKIFLLLYVCIIIAVFVWEYRRKPTVSLALWVPQIWVLISASRPVYLWFYPDPVALDDIDYLSGNPVDRNILSVLLVIGLIILLKRSVDWPSTFKKNIWLFLVFVLMGISIAWSDFPAVSFKRWIRSTGDLVMALLVLTENKPGEAIKTLIMRIGLLLLPLSVILIKYFPDIGVAYTIDGLMKMWTGVTTHKNELGVLSLICGVFLVWHMMTFWRTSKIQYLQVLLLLMVFWLLRGSTSSDSKTSILAFVLSCCLLVFLKLLAARPRLVGPMILAMALIFFFFNGLSQGLANSSLYDLILKAAGRDTTLTGRTDLWKELLGIAAENPFFGRGYGSFWIGNTHNLWYKFIWLPTQGHNGYIDVFLELGLVGFLFLIAAIMHAAKNILKELNTDYAHASLRLVFFLMILIHNYTESSFLRGSSFLWFIFLLFAANPPAVKKTVRETAVIAQKDRVPGAGAISSFRNSFLRKATAEGSDELHKMFSVEQCSFVHPVSFKIQKTK